LSAFLHVQHSCADFAQVPKPCSGVRTAVFTVFEMLTFGLILGLAIAPPLSAETVKSKEVSSKPPTTVAKLKDSTKAMPEAASVKNTSADPALCVPRDGAAKSTANDSGSGDGPSRAVIAPANADSGDAELGGQSTSDHSNSEIITDKLKLSLEPKTDTTSEPAAQCGREENGTHARGNADAPPN
jgi:hypothetical protein